MNVSGNLMRGIEKGSREGGDGLSIQQIHHLIDFGFADVSWDTEPLVMILGFIIVVNAFIAGWGFV